MRWVLVAIAACTRPVPPLHNIATGSAPMDLAAWSATFAQRAVELLHGQRQPTPSKACENYDPDQVHEVDGIDAELRTAGRAVAIVATFHLWRPLPGGHADAFGVDAQSISVDMLVTPERHFEILELEAVNYTYGCTDGCSAIDSMPHSELAWLAPPVVSEARRLLVSLASPRCMAELYTELDAATCARLAPELGCQEFQRRRRASLELSCALMRGITVDDRWSAETGTVDALLDNGRARAWIATWVSSNQHELCGGGIDGNKYRARPRSLAEH